MPKPGFAARDYVALHSDDRLAQRLNVNSCSVMLGTACLPVLHMRLVSMYGLLQGSCRARVLLAAAATEFAGACTGCN